MEQQAHNLPEILHFIEDVPWARGIIFGFVHTLIPLIGFYSGWSINRFLKIISNGAIAGIIGVVFAHIIADFIAAILDPSLKSAAIGIVIGGLIPLSVVPFLEKYLTKSKYHIVAGDHEDIKTDISKKHK